MSSVIPAREGAHSANDRIAGHPQTTDASATKGSRWALAALIGFALITSFVGLNSGPSLGDHECINAQAARQTLQSGRWLIPQVGEIPRVRKTPLGIWTIAAASLLVDGPHANPPVSDLSARLPSAVAAFATTLVVFWLGRMMYGYTAGLIAGFIWAGSTAAVVFSHSALVDTWLTLFTALSFACFWRGAVHSPRSKAAMVCFYLAFAMAMMAKAPLPLATVGMSLAIYWLVTIPLVSAAEEPATGWRPWLARAASRSRSQFKQIGSLWILPGTILWLIVIGVWPAYVLAHVPSAGTLWRVEYIDMLLGESSGKHQPFLYYIPIIFALMGPYLLSVPESVAAPFLAKYRQYRPGLAFVFTWAVWGLFFLSTSSVKRWHYPLSVAPAFCLLLAPVIDQLFFGPRFSTASRRVRLATTILPVVMAAGVTIGAYLVFRNYPDMLSSYMVVALVLLAVWTAASLSYAVGRRTASFALLNAGVVVLACAAWPIAGGHVEMNPGANRLVAEFQKHGVRPDDPIYIVDNRPDSSIEFYHFYRVQRLVNELEMAGLRPNRREIPRQLYERMLRDIAEKLREPNPVYLILKSSNYDRLTNNSDVQARVLFRVADPDRKPGDQQLVITQPNSASSPG